IDDSPRRSPGARVGVVPRPIGLRGPGSPALRGRVENRRRGLLPVSFPRVLVATGSAGHGHLRAARAVVSALRTRHPAIEHGAVGHALTLLSSGGFVRAVRAWKPDLVVCTHFLAPEVLAHEARRGRLAAPVHVVVTDHDCHRLWWHPEVEAYHVASDLVKARLCYRFGVPPERVHVTGIPIDPDF